MSKELIMNELERRLKAMEPQEQQEAIAKIRQEIIKNQQTKNQAINQKTS